MIEEKRLSGGDRHMHDDVIREGPNKYLGALFR